MLFANRAAHRVAGGAFPLEHEAPEYRRVAAGERLANVRIDWDTPAGTRALIASGDMLHPPGRPPLAVLTFEDVTELEATHRRTATLADAGALLAGSLDFDAMLELTAKMAVPRLGDWCSVELLRDDGTVEHVAVATADPELLTHVRELHRRFPTAPDASAGPAQVIRTGVPELLPEVTDAMLRAWARDPEQLELLRTLGCHSSMTVPLRSGGRVIGALAVLSAGSGRHFTTADLAAAQELANRCGLHLENAGLYRELQRARDELDAILSGVADAVTVQTADGRLTYVNDAAVRLLGVPIGLTDAAALLAATPQELSARYEILAEDGQPFPIDRLPGRLVLAGAEAAPAIMEYRVRATGESRWARVKARPLRSAGRGVDRAINVVEDITDLKRAEATQRLLAEAGRVLAGSLDYETTLRRVAWLAVPVVGDWCMVDLVGDHGLERMAVAHADPEQTALAAAMEGLAIHPDGAVGPAAVARTGRAELREHVDAEWVRKAALNPVHHALLSELGVRSAASVPLTVRGQRLGVMTLYTAGSGRTLRPEQLAVLEELGRRAAISVDSARLYRQRSAIARTLQNSLLPPVLPEIAGVETAALYRAAGEGTDVGGDFYDLFSVGPEAWIAVMGDVCGKGAEAAAVTALARYTIRAAAVRRHSPAAILRWLNDVMRRQDLDGRFATIACAHLDTSRPLIRATVACAGHPPALLRRATGAVEELGAVGTLLGPVANPRIEDTRTELRAGDALVLYTDGITEARAPERMLGPEDLLRALAALPDGSAQRIVEHLAALAVGKEGTPPRDDIALLALRAKG